MKKKITIISAAVMFAALVAPQAHAKLPWVKKGKPYDTGVTSCLSCHISKTPKKGKASPNHRGQWLLDEKDRRKAEEIDLAWLKDYPKNGQNVSEDNKDK